DGIRDRTVTGVQTCLFRSVHAVPAGQSLSDMLVAGEIDAMFSPPRPSRYDRMAGPIVRLFPDFRGIERDYFRQTGCFPPQHLIEIGRASCRERVLISVVGG